MPHNVATSPKPWTMQGYFDEAVRYLSTMPHRCYSIELGGCLYRRGDEACVVGHFIPNDSEVALRPSHFITVGAADLPANDLAGVAWPTHPDGRELARELQDAHDDLDHWYDGEHDGGEGFCDAELLYRIAAQFGLDPAEIDRHTWGTPS